MPPEAKVITGVDVEHARSSEFGQYMLKRINTENQDFERFNEETGFDPRRDLQSLVFASPAASGSESHFAILARGVFDQARMEAAAKARGAMVQNYQGVELILDNEAIRRPVSPF